MRKYYGMLIPLLVLFTFIYVLPNNENAAKKTIQIEVETRLSQQPNHLRHHRASEVVVIETSSKVIKLVNNKQQWTRIGEQLTELNEAGLRAYLSGLSETNADLEAYYDETRWLAFYLSLGYDEDDIAAMIALRSQSMSDEYQQTASDPDPSIPPHSILVEILASNVIAYFREETGLTFQQVIDFSVQDIHQSYSVPNGTILNFAHLYLIDELERRLENFAADEQEVQFDERSSALTRQFVAYLDSDDEYIHQAKDPVVFSETNLVEQEYDVESETIE
ncbi:hypothetical protein ACPV5O_03885 [Vibrio maritimus]|uniref:hypothetical protein n=1 Tax=Vibrio maritimus TaxID=990268 RepID=UPI004068BBE3